MMTTGVPGHAAAGGAGAVAPAGEATEERRRRFRRTVRDLMVARGYTQKELGERAGLSKSGVGRLLAGERDPRAGTVERLAAALGVTAGALLDGPHTPGSALSTPGGLAPTLGGTGRYAGVHSTHSGWPGGGPGADADAEHAAVGAGGTARVQAVVYPGFVLWGRADPRAGAAPAGGEPRLVMRERVSGCGGRSAPGYGGCGCPGRMQVRD